MLEWVCVVRACVCVCVYVCVCVCVCGGGGGGGGGGATGEGDNFGIRKALNGRICTSFYVAPKRTIACEAPDFELWSSIVSNYGAA